VARARVNDVFNLLEPRALFVVYTIYIYTHALDVIHTHTHTYIYKYYISLDPSAAISHTANLSIHKHVRNEKAYKI
jgi:hypothetical protein